MAFSAAPDTIAADILWMADIHLLEFGKRLMKLTKRVAVSEQSLTFPVGRVEVALEKLRISILSTLLNLFACIMFILCG